MPPLPPGDITRLLRGDNGDSNSAEALWRVITAELRRIAEREMRGDKGARTLHPTALVNEAYVKLFRGNPASFNDRQHFFSVAAHAMRTILVDYARARGAIKRTVHGTRVPLEHVCDEFEARGIDMEALGAKLDTYATLDPGGARIFEMHHFLEMSTREISEILNSSVRTIERELQVARAWLERALREP